MERIPNQRFAEVISHGLNLIPAAIRGFVGRVPFFCADPIFAGLHDYETTTDGRSYRTTPHCTYSHHTNGGETTVVLPVLYRNPTWGRSVIVHEFAHVLDERVGFQKGFTPTTTYAETNDAEAFAEAFCAWVLPPGAGYDAARYKLTRRDRAFFDNLLATAH